MDTKPLWKKYGLSMCTDHFEMRRLYSEEEVLKYIDMVILAHDCVAQYWEDNGGRTIYYYEALKRSNPILDKEISDWSEDYWIRRAKQKEKEDNYTCMVWHPETNQYVPTKMKDLEKTRG